MAKDVPPDGFGLERRELLRRGAFVGSALGVGVGTTSVSSVARASTQTPDGPVFTFPDFDDVSEGDLPAEWSVRQAGSGASVGVTNDTIDDGRSLLLDDDGGGWAWVEAEAEGTKGVAFTCRLEPNSIRSSHHQVGVFTEDWGIGFGARSSNDSFDLVYARSPSDTADAVNFQSGTAPDETVSDVFDWGETVTVAVLNVGDGIEVRVDGEAVVEADGDLPAAGTLEVRADDLAARFDTPAVGPAPIEHRDCRPDAAPIYEFPNVDTVRDEYRPDGWSTDGSVTDEDPVHGSRSLRLDGDFSGAEAWRAVQGGIAFSCRLDGMDAGSMHVSTTDWAVSFERDLGDEAFDLAYRTTTVDHRPVAQPVGDPDERVQNVVEPGEEVTVAIVDVDRGLEVHIDGETVLETGDEHSPSGTVGLSCDGLVGWFDAPKSAPEDPTLPTTATGSGGSSTAPGRATESALVVEQDGTTYDVEPVRHDDEIETFYDYGAIRASADTPSDIEGGAQASKLFVYEGPEGPSLVVVHDFHDYPNSTESGGRAVFEFEGLEGEWVVEDDPGDWSRSESSPPERIDWQWNDQNTDGGAFRFDTDQFEVTIAPEFRDGIDSWELLSGVDTEGGAELSERLDPTSPVTIRYGSGTVHCKTRPSDRGIDTAEVHSRTQRTVVGGRGACSLWAAGTETLFHEFFALEAGDEVVTSYDEEVEVVDELAEAGPGHRSYESTVHVPLAGETLEVTREVHVHRSSPRVSIDYRIEATSGSSSIAPTLYAAVDFDVTDDSTDRGGYHEEGEFAYVEDATGDEDLVAGVGGDVVPDEYGFLPYPAYDTVESGAVGSDDAEADPDDLVTVVAFELEEIGSIGSSRQVRFGASNSIDGLRDVLGRRVDISLESPRLSQSVSDSRLVDGSGPTADVLREIDDPPMIAGKETTTLVELDVRNEGASDDEEDVELTVRERIPHGTADALRTTFRETVELEYEVIEQAASTSDPLSELVGELPSFELSDAVSEVDVRIGTARDDVNGDHVTLEIGTDFEVEETDPLTVGFVPVVDTETDYQNDFASDYWSETREAVELLEKMYPVPEVRAYIERSTISMSDLDDPDCAMLKDGYDAKSSLVDETPIDASDTEGGQGAIDSFDVTVAVVQNHYFDERGKSDTGGTHKSEIAAAALSKTDAKTMVHEIGHHFSGDVYEEPDRDHELAQRDDDGDTTVEQDGQEVAIDFAHARDTASHRAGVTDDPGLKCRKAEIEDGNLCATEVTDPLMSYGDERWIDSFQYTDMIEHGLEPHPRETNKGRAGRRLVNTMRCTADGLTDVDHSVRIENDRPVSVSEEGPVEVEVLDAAGDVLSSHRELAYTEFTADGPGDTDDGVLQATFVRVPFPEEAVYLRTTYEGETVTTNVLASSLRDAIGGLPEDAYVARQTVVGLS